MGTLMSVYIGIGLFKLIGLAIMSCDIIEHMLLRVPISDSFNASELKIAAKSATKLKYKSLNKRKKNLH
jgi:hypothetical protein